MTVQVRQKGRMQKVKPIASRRRGRLYQTLAQAERAGLPLEQALKLCAAIGDDVGAAVAFTGQRISGGATLAAAGWRAGLWSGTEYEVIKAAETAGNAGQIFQRLADYHQQRLAAHRAMMRGLILPGILLLAALLIPPLPALVSGELPLGQYIWIPVRALLSLALLVVLVIQLPRLMRLVSTTAVAFDRLQVVTPVIGPWYFRRQMREFINSLALLLNAGVPAQEAVAMAIPSPNTEVRQRIDKMVNGLADGAGFADALARIEGINQQAVAMAASGEGAGKLDTMLQHYSALETELTRRQERQLTTGLPRVVYLVVAIWVGWQMVAGAVS